jgi:hypothetical protein
MNEKPLVRYVNADGCFWSRRAQWWDTADTYHYMRIEQRQDFDVLVVGGEDTSTGMKPRDFHDPYGNLAKWAKARWTSAEEVLYIWTGQVCHCYHHRD